MLCRVIQIITAAVAGISHNMTDIPCHIYLVTVLKEQIYSGANRERPALRNPRVQEWVDLIRDIAAIQVHTDGTNCKLNSMFGGFFFAFAATN